MNFPKKHIPNYPGDLSDALARGYLTLHEYHRYVNSFFAPNSQIRMRDLINFADYKIRRPISHDPHGVTHLYVWLFSKDKCELNFILANIRQKKFSGKKK